MTTDLLRSRIHSGIKWSAAAAYIRWGMRFFVLAILATLIDKREFGLLEIATVIILITQNFSELGIGQAIIWHRGHLADDPDSTDAIAATLNSGFWIVVTLNMTLLVLAFFAAPLVAAYAQEPRATLVIQVLLISTIFGTLTIVPRTQLERDLAFRAAALPEVLPSVASGIVSIILAVMYRNVWALVAGQVVHAAMRFLLYAWAARWIPRMQFDGAVCKELLKFSMPLLGAGLINMMIAIMPTAIIVRMLGLEAVGVYGLAHRVAVLPLFGIIYVIGRVMFPVYTRFQNDLHGMRRGVVEALRLTTVIAAPVCLGIATIIPAAELVVYHGRWWDMPFPLAVLILLTLQRVVGSIAGDVCKATGRPGLTQLFFGVRLVVLVPACLLGGLGWGLNGAVIGVLLANTASLVLEVRKMHERIDLSPWEIFDAVKLPLAAAGLACTAAALVLNSMLLGPTIAGLVVGVGAAAIIYIWLMFTFERPMIWALRAAMFSREKPSGSVAAVAAHEPLRPTPAASDPSAIMGRWFVRHITYPLLGPILKGIDGKGVLEAYGKYGESERWPIERHREEQWRRIQALIRHAHGNCPLHRERFQAIGAEPGDFKSLEDYAKLPPLRREELQTHLARLIAENADPNDYELHSTSGSTGTPLSIAVDKSRLIPIRAMVHRNQDWIGLHFGDRVALLWAGFAERHSARQLSNRIGLWALNQMWESAWDLSDDALAQFCNRMRRQRAQLLISFSSTLVTFAQLIQRRGMTPPDLLGIISTGETLFSQQRALIEATFDTRVFNRYGSVEMGDIAHECAAHDGLHCNEERIYTELAHDPELPEGVGDIIVTDLDNWSMPILRYTTGDLARWHDDPTGCPCGRPLRRLGEVQGRRYDVIRDRNGVHINGLVFEDIGSGAEGVAQFQCIQKTAEHLLFRVVPLPGYSAEQIRENMIERSKRSIGPDRFEISVEIVDSIALSKSGKLRQIVSEVTD